MNDDQKIGIERLMAKSTEIERRIQLKCQLIELTAKEIRNLHTELKANNILFEKMQLG